MTETTFTNTENLSEFQPKALPGALNVLTILTFIGCAIGAIFTFATPWLMKFSLGMMNKAAGAVKENLGHVFGAKEMEQRGAAQRAVGDAEWELARQKGAAAGQEKQVEGSYKEGYGHTAGQPTTTASGATERLAGEAQERWNK